MIELVMCVCPCHRKRLILSIIDGNRFNFIIKHVWFYEANKYGFYIEFQMFLLCFD